MVMSATTLAPGTPGSMTERLDDRSFQAESAFHLEGRVRNVVRDQKELLDGAQNLRLPSPELRRDLHMGRERLNVRADGPDVQVVNVAHPLHAANGIRHRRGAHPPGDPFQEDMDGAPQYSPGTPEDNDSYPHRDDRIENIPVGVVDDNPAGDDPHRGCCVPHDMEEGALHIEVIVGVPVEDRGGEKVGNESHGGDDEHGETLHRLRSDQPAGRLVENSHRHEKDRGAIDEGGKDLGTVPAEGPGVRDRIRSKPDRHQGENEGKEVEKDVGRIREKRQGVGPDAADDLGQQSQGREQDGPDESPRDAPVQMQIISQRCVGHESPKNQWQLSACRPTSLHAPPRR